MLEDKRGRRIRVVACLAAFAAALLVSLLAAPAPAFAATATFQINGETMVDGVPVECGEGTATWSEDGGTLMLKNATITSFRSDSSVSPANHVVRVDNGDLKIVLDGVNRIESLVQGIYGNGTNLTFSGVGSLSIEAESDAVVIDGGSVIVDECAIDICSKNDTGLYCAPGMSTVYIGNGAHVVVESYDDAITATGGLFISDSTVTAASSGPETDVVYSDMDIHISNSTVSATGTGADSAIYAGRDIHIMDRSDVTATSEGMQGIYAGRDMMIDESTVRAVGTTQEGMVVQRSLTIDDSKVAATGCPDPAAPAIRASGLDIIGASEVTCYGGVNATEWLLVNPDRDTLVDVMVGTLQGDADGAGHFDRCGVTSPLSSTTVFDDFSEDGSTALDWLETYTYVRIGEHAHVFDQEVAADRYKVADATCTDAAIYYLSCVCEEAGTGTFASGSPLGHEWGEPAWSWTEDYSSATAEFICKRDESHTQAVPATVTSETTDPTATEAGSTVYTASVELGGLIYRDVQTVIIPATGTAGDGPGGSSPNEPGQGDGRAEGETAQGDDEADDTALPKTGDDSGTALLLAGALAAAGACSVMLAWRMIRKAD